DSYSSYKYAPTTYIYTLSLHNALPISHRRTELVDMVEEVLETGRPIRAVEKIFKVREFEELPVLDFEGRTRATLKIQDGCNEFRSEEHTSELQSRENLVCRLLLEKKKK